MIYRPLTRRDFLYQTSLSEAGLWLIEARAASVRADSPNNKLNVALLATANRAGADLKAVAHENIVALCDVDDTFLAQAKEKFPAAKTYNDFRKMLEQKDIDAVVVGTADHTHAVATAA